MTELFHVTAYGGLSTIPTISNQIVTRFINMEGYTLEIHQVISDYLAATNVNTLTEDETQRQKKWNNLSTSLANAIPDPALQALSISGSNSDAEDANDINISHQVKSTITLPTYDDGTFGSASKFVRAFKSHTNENNYSEERKWKLLIMQCTSHALRTINRQKDIFGKDVQKHLDYLQFYFDNKDPEQMQDSFLANLRQQKNERVQIFRSHFDNRTTDLIEDGMMVSYSENPSLYKLEQATFFLNKLNREFMDLVDEFVDGWGGTRKGKNRCSCITHEEHHFRSLPDRPPCFPEDLF